MFTGIVHSTVTLVDIIKKNDFQTHIVQFDDALLDGLAIGSSVAHNGCCLTVTQIKGNKVAFDLMQETLKVTNLGDLQVGDAVNIERAARFGDEIGGHQMSGHILFMAKIKNINKSENNCQITFEIPDVYLYYIFNKGYIGIDGISLTVGELVGNTFNVNLIPETLQRTNLNNRQVGERINIEIDPQTQAIVETIERILKDIT
jgi:riboflavin synthase